MTMDKFAGDIQVITGPMFAGKTKQLILAARKAEYEGKIVLIVKPCVDTRGDPDRVSSHDGFWYPAIRIEKAIDILSLLEPNVSFLGIDEAQFFDNQIVKVCQEVAHRGIQVLVNGLDLDYRGLPFGPMPQLISIANNVCYLTAQCDICNQPARFSQRLVDGQPFHDDASLILIGGKETYQARCSHHYLPPH